MNKVLKVFLISKVTDKDGNEVDYKEVNKILWELQRQTRIIKNKAIQKCWEWYGFTSDYNFFCGSYPKEKDHLGYTLSSYVYDRLKNDSILNSGNFITTIKGCCDKFKNEKKEYLVGDKSIANYKKDQPLDLHNKSISLEYKENRFYITLSLLNKKAMSEYNINRFTFECVVKDKSTRTILERCYDGIYKISGSNLIYDKKKMWRLNLCYSFESQKINDLDEDKILGVDLGVAKPIVASVYGDYDRFMIEGNEIETFRNKCEARRKSLLKQGKYCGEGRIGHGYNTRIAPANKISDKISRFRDTTNFKYAKALVDYAVKNNCGVIQMEDLSGISSDDSFLKKWSYFDLQTKIINKAAERGIKVVKIDPKYTSKRCSKCGCIHDDNRKTQSNFECVNCGFKANADYNASQNIAIKDIDLIIKEYCKENDIKHSAKAKQTRIA